MANRTVTALRPGAAVGDASPDRHRATADNEPEDLEWATLAALPETELDAKVQSLKAAKRLETVVQPDFGETSDFYLQPTEADVSETPPTDLATIAAELGCDLLSPNSLRASKQPRSEARSDLLRKAHREQLEVESERRGDDGSYLVSTREQAATAAQKARASMLSHSRRTRSMPMLQLRAQIEAAVRSSGGAVAPAVAAAPAGSRRSSVAGSSLAAAAAATVAARRHPSARRRRKNTPALKRGSAAAAAVSDDDSSSDDGEATAGGGGG